MATREEYANKLGELVGKVTGSFKSKADGLWVKVLSGRLNKNFGYAEMNVCLEHLQQAVEDGQYAWTDKQGKTWVPIRLNVFAGTKSDPMVTPVKEEKKASPSDDLSDEIPF